MRIVLLALMMAFVGVSCKSDKASTKKTTAESTQKATKKSYTLTPFAASTAYPDATIKGYTYKGGKFSYDVEGTDYKLGAQTPDAAQKMCANSGKGQHIHLIVGDKPYAAKYTADFDHDVEDGEHYMLAFLSRSYHESIKTDAASTAQKVVVKDKSIVAAKDIKEPMLFYSRPKGTYVGEANTKKVMLDFYLVNTTMDGKKVQVDINGEEYHVDKWQPYYIEGLPMGENKVTLTLLNADGSKVDAPHNPVTRVFTLKADPIEES